jgi:hypothetical protein
MAPCSGGCKQLVQAARIEFLPGHSAPGGKELFARMRECMTAAKKKLLANDAAEGFVSECVQQVASTEMFS